MANHPNRSRKRSRKFELELTAGELAAIQEGLGMAYKRAQQSEKQARMAVIGQLSNRLEQLWASAAR